jgi:hypothetical protein
VLLLPFPLGSCPSRYPLFVLGRSPRSRWPCSQGIRCWLERILPIPRRGIYLILMLASAKIEGNPKRRSRAYTNESLQP